MVGSFLISNVSQKITGPPNCMPQLPAIGSGGASVWARKGPPPSQKKKKFKTIDFELRFIRFGDRTRNMIHRIVFRHSARRTCAHAEKIGPSKGRLRRGQPLIRRIRKEYWCFLDFETKI